jgi:chitinase
MPANRQNFANNLASFVQNEGLDGIDIDWEVRTSHSFSRSNY